jgi:transcription-repair coupling factor (superfamily II helicase)
MLVYINIEKARCMVEVESDVAWRQQPVDRLLCGDVGFGE